MPLTDPILQESEGVILEHGPGRGRELRFHGSTALQHIVHDSCCGFSAVAEVVVVGKRLSGRGKASDQFLDLRWDAFQVGAQPLHQLNKGVDVLPHALHLFHLGLLRLLLALHVTVRHGLTEVDAPAPSQCAALSKQQQLLAMK